jgi:tetratricopeptide (TPR) repeat protein
MKRISILFLAIFMALPAFSQALTTRQAYKDRYRLLVSKLGNDGVGIETLLNQWAEDYPDDLDMLLGKFSYYLAKSQSETVERMDRSKYLGAGPALTLKDSLGNDVNYFQVTNFDDARFGLATQAIDRAIGLNQNRLDLRFYKISALISYEKESPDMALSDLKALIDYQGVSHPRWEYPDMEVTDEVFAASVQEYCYVFFRIGSPSSFEAFREISQKMLAYFPDDPVFQTNLGSYELVYKQNNKAALKIYKKVLKKHPDDYPTIKNCVLLARSDKNTKLEKKYLPMLIRTTTDEAEKAAATARLNAL